MAGGVAKEPFIFVPQTFGILVLSNIGGRAAVGSGGGPDEGGKRGLVFEKTGLD